MKSKRIKKACQPVTLAADSLTARNLVRHAMPRPSIRFVDKKKKENKNACR